MLWWGGELWVRWGKCWGSKERREAILLHRVLLGKVGSTLSRVMREYEGSYYIYERERVGRTLWKWWEGEEVSWLDNRVLLWIAVKVGEVVGSMFSRQSLSETKEGEEVDSSVLIIIVKMNSRGDNIATTISTSGWRIVTISTQ